MFRKSFRSAGLISVLLFLVASMSLAVGVKEVPLIIQEEALTTDDLIEIALKNHFSYRKQQEDIDLLQDGMKAAYAQFLPVVRASANYGDYRSKNPNRSDYVDPGLKTDQSVSKTNSTELSLSLYQNIFDGGYRYFSLNQAKLYLQNADLSSQSVNNQIVFNVKSAVNSYLASEEFLKVAKEVLEFRKESLRLAKARFNNGDVIELDVLQAEIDMGDAENEVLSAQQGVENAREALNLIVGIQLESRFPINGDFTPVFPEVEIEKLIHEGMRSNPEFKSLEKNLLIKEESIKVARSYMLPSVDLSASYSKSEQSSGYNHFMLNPAIENRSVSLGVSYNIFNRLENKYRKQQAVVEKRKAFWDKRNGSLELESGIRNGLRDLTRLHQQIRVTEKNRELARRQLDLEQERYRLGASSQLNLRSAQVTFIQAENQHISKVFEFLTTRAQLEQNLGCPLEEVME